MRRPAVRSKHAYTGPPRCAIYVRVSDPKQERDGTSLVTQEASCRAYAHDCGYVVSAVHHDVHTGADIFERSGLSALRAAVRVQEVDVVVAHALDRLSRDQNHLGLLFSECDHKNVRVEFVTEQLEDTAEGRLLQAVRGFVAEIERAKIRERTQRGTYARATAGKLLASSRPLYGYTWRDDTKGALDIDPITAPVVRRIFQESSAGISIRKIAKALTTEAVSTPTGLNVWSPSTVQWILSHRAYIGQAAAYHSSREHDRKSLALPEGTIPAIIEISMFEVVQHRLILNKQRSVRNNHCPDATLLRGGVARCGYCGNAVSTRQERGRSSHSYFCSTTNRDRYGCPAFNVRAHLLDTEIWNIVECFLTDESVIAAKIAAMGTTDPESDEMAVVEKRTSAIQERQERLARAISNLDDEAAAAPLLVELKSLAAQAKQSDTKRAAIQTRRLQREMSRQYIGSLLEWRERIAENLPRLTYDHRRQLLDVLGVTVLIRAIGDEPRWELILQPGHSHVDSAIVYGTASGFGRPSRTAAGGCRTAG